MPVFCGLLDDAAVRPVGAVSHPHTSIAGSLHPRLGDSSSNTPTLIWASAWPAHSHKRSDVNVSAVLLTA